MKLRFSKMHGLGNDFMIIDCVQQSVKLTEDLIRQWSDRHTGIGFDQLLVVAPSNDKKNASFYYQIFNGDGSEVFQCGNGVRCVAKFVYDKGLLGEKSFRVKTKMGYMSLAVLDNGQVRVDMGVPDFGANTLPTGSDIANSNVSITEHPFEFRGEKVKFSAVSMGNPHAVIAVDDIHSAPLETLGKHLQSSGIFPEGVNVNFVEILDSDTVKLRVLERGVGETRACGSGACATVAALKKQGLVGAEVLVQLSGGDLVIQWYADNQSLEMTGDAVHVYDGEIVL